jgi:hypothetical protein
MYAGAKAVFYSLSRSATLKRLASKYGMRSRDSFARRFIAGETVEEAVETSRHVASAPLRKLTRRHARTSGSSTSSSPPESNGTSR